VLFSLYTSLQGVIILPMCKIIQHLHIVLLCALCVFFAPLSGHAQANATEFSISSSLLHFDYQEFNDYGKLLDREEGYIPGLAIAINQPVGQWLLGLTLSYHSGETAYSGQTTSGIPITTTTRQNIVDAAVQTEYWLLTAHNLQYAPYFGLGYHLWQRDILPTTTAGGAPVYGLFENYSWWIGFIGIKTQLYSNDDYSCILDMRLTQTIKPEITVDFGGNYDKAALPLGERMGARIALPWRHRLSTDADLLLEPSAEYYELGRSATAPLTSHGTVAGNVYEPSSKTFNYALQLGLSQRF